MNQFHCISSFRLSSTQFVYFLWNFLMCIPIRISKCRMKINFIDEIYYSNVSFDQSKRIRNSVLCLLRLERVTLTVNSVQKKLGTIFQMQIVSTNFSTHCSFSCWRAKFYARLLQATIKTLQLLALFCFLV